MNVRVLLIILAVGLQTWLWTADGSGASRVRFVSQYPEGYNFFLESSGESPFPIGREDTRYIAQYLAFLGAPQLGLVADWPAERNLYSLALSGLWPFGVVAAGACVNALFWLAAIWGASQLAEDRDQPRAGVVGTFAVVISLFHLPFLWSVGETNPHLAGFATGAIIVGAAFRARLFEHGSPYAQHLALALLAGLLTLFYHAALLFLPFLLLTFLSSRLQTWNARAVVASLRIGNLWRGALLLGAVVAPLLAFRRVLTMLGLLPEGTSTEGALFALLGRRLAGIEWVDVVQLMVLDQLAALHSFGVLVAVPLIVGAVCIVRHGSRGQRITLCSGLIITVGLVPNYLAGDVGYAIANGSIAGILAAAVGMSFLTTRARNRTQQIVIGCYALSLCAYSAFALRGWNYPLVASFGGHPLPGMSAVKLPSKEKYLHADVSYVEERF
ncbi:MAG: hypothetical protein IT290_07640 [Deltaproteobacteria bacterium]|nr:hypothetical protein [Deltaproteobacteria bacterium]